MFVTSDKVSPLAESIPKEDWDALNEFMFNPAPGMETVTEGYVGKTKELQEIEKLLNQMIKKYTADSIVNASKSELNKCAEKRQIEALLKKEFGFAKAELLIMPQVIADAGTIPASILLRDAAADMPTSLTAHGEKYYDESHNYDFFMMLTTEMFSGTYTGGELTAIILHEVGHNFDVSLMSYIGDVLYWATCISHADIFSPTVGHIIAKYLTKFVNAVLSLTPVSILANTGLTLLKLVAQVSGPFGSLAYIGMMLKDKAPSVRTIINIFTGFSGERFADSFVTAYGYGQELISAIDKIDTQFQQRKKGFFIDTWTWSGTIAPTILNMVIDPHPEAQTRARLVLDDMKKLSENPDLPKNIKAAVKADYDRCKKGYDAFLQVEPDQRDSIAQRFTRQSKEAILAGKCDLRSYLFNCSAVQAGVSVVNHSKKR